MSRGRSWDWGENRNSLENNSQKTKDLNTWLYWYNHIKNKLKKQFK